MSTPPTLTAPNDNPQPVALPPRAAARPAQPAPAAPAAPGQPPAGAVAPVSARVPKASAEPASPWATVFRDWPAEIPTRGVVVSKLNDSAQFKGFMLQGELVLFERTAPDALGGRFFILPFGEIATLKYTDPLKQVAFEAAGFAGKLTQ